jgi:hypothetical protein
LMAGGLGATGLFPLYPAVSAGDGSTQASGQDLGLARIFRFSRAAGKPIKQVTKLGNADGLLIY